MEKSKEYSEQQAHHITSIMVILMQMDIPYLKEMAKDMYKQASFQESAAVLNPSYPSEKNDLLRMSAKAVETLCSYHDQLQEIQKMKDNLKTIEHNRQRIDKLFN